MRNPFRNEASARRNVMGMIGVGAVAALFSAVKVADPDLGWLLAGGKLVWQGGIPVLNTFSHTYPEAPWPFYQWLFGAALRAFEIVGGLSAVEGLQILLVVASFAIAYDTFRRRGKDPSFLPALPILLIALSASRFRFVPRPHLASFVGLALLLNLWERRSRWTPVWFGLLGIVWGNSHTGVVFGLLAAGLIVVSAAVSGNRPDAKTALLSFAALAAGSLANPFFHHPHLYSFGHISLEKIIPLEELRGSSLETETSFFVLAGLSVAAIPFRIGRKDFLYPLLVGGFLPLAFFAMRLIPKFLLVAMPGICLTAGELWSRLSERKLPGFVPHLSAAALFAAALFLCHRDYRANAVVAEFGWGTNDRMFPKEAAGFIRDRGLSGNMYNDYSQGGYLAWALYPERRVFLDGRTNAYPAEFLREYLGSMSREGWPSFMEKHRVEYAVVERRPTGSAIDMSAYFEGMGWPMVYLDGISYVFVKPGSENDRRTAEIRFRLIGPRTPADLLSSRGREQPAAMRAELRRIDPARLIRPEDFARFGGAAFLSGDPQAAAAFFRSGISLHPDDPGLRINLAYVLFTEGRMTEARKEYEEAAKKGEDALAGIARKRMEEIDRGSRPMR
jgi:hypothetical protein